MKSKNYLNLKFLCLLATSFFIFSCNQKNAESYLKDKSLPNILIFIGDDMNWNDCEPYGNTVVKTPNIQRLANEGISFDVHPVKSAPPALGILGNLLFPAILIGGLILLARRSNGMPGGPGQAMQFGKSKAKFAMNADTGVVFDDVAGVNEAKEDLEEVFPLPLLVENGVAALNKFIHEYGPTNKKIG